MDKEEPAQECVQHVKEPPCIFFVLVTLDAATVMLRLTSLSIQRQCFLELKNKLPTLSRLNLKPSPREFDLAVFNEYYSELKKNTLRYRLFTVILISRNFSELRAINEDRPEQAQLEINQCLIEALDIAVNTPDEDLEEEFALFGMKFSVDTSSYTSPITLRSSILQQ